MKAGIRMAKNVFICCSRCKDIWWGSFETLPPVYGMWVFVCESEMDWFLISFLRLARNVLKWLTGSQKQDFNTANSHEERFQSAF